MITGETQPPSAGGGTGEVVATLTVTGLTASRLVATDGSKMLASVSNLASWVAGTSNQVTVTDDGDGTLTLSTPQSIGTGSSPTFAGVTLSGLTASRLAATDGSKALTSVSNLASWVAGISNQVVVTDDGDGSITLSTPQSIGTGSSPTFSGATLSGLTAGLIVYTGVGGLLSVDTSFAWDATNDRFRIGADDSVNSTGQGSLNVTGNTSFRFSMRVYDGSDADARSDFAFFRARGSMATPTTVQSGDTLGSLTWDGYHSGGSWAEGAKIDAVVDGARTTYWPTTLRFKTSDATNSFVYRWGINSSGHWVAGTNNAFDFGASGTAARSIYASTAIYVGTSTPASTYGLGLNVAGTTAGLFLYETDAASNEKGWSIEASGGDLYIMGVPDNGGTGSQYLKIVRGTGTAIASLEIDSAVTLGGSTNQFDLGATGTRWRTLYVGTSLVGPDGSVSTPALQGSSTNSGVYFRSGTSFVVSSSGVAVFEANSSAIQMLNTLSLKWCVNPNGGNASVSLVCEASNSLSLYNSDTPTVAQLFYIYNSRTSGSVYEVMAVGWSSNEAFIQTGSAGGATQRTLSFGAAGSRRWLITTAGHWVGYADNSYDIGAAGATRPRDIHVGRNVVIGGALDHDGSTAGVFGVTPASRVAAYTPTNVSADRSYDANATTVEELADVVGTIIADMQTYGWFQ